MLNLTPDHLERHGTMRDYARTKCRLFFHMTGAKLGLLCFGMHFVILLVNVFWVYRIFLKLFLTSIVRNLPIIAVLLIGSY